LNIWIHVLRPDSLTYTIAKALSHRGHESTVCVLNPAFGGRPPGRIEQQVYRIPRVSVVARAETRVPAIDRLVVQVFPRPADSLPGIRALSSRARRITLITAGDRSRAQREATAIQWLEARRLGIDLRKVDRLLYKDGWHPRDLLRFLGSRQVVGFDVHSQFLQDDALFHAIHARDWDAEARRPIAANFIGSRDPQARTRILDSARTPFREQAESLPAMRPGKTMLWQEYSDAAPAALAPEAFVRILSNSDFTLCPRGYSLVTHRPIEALLRGSIPVVAADELDLYGFPLNDGRNCIAVPGGAWPEAMQRIARIGERALVEMRRNIAAMFESDLDYDALSRRICSRLGVES
jgi:hypothetical protein